MRYVEMKAMNAASLSDKLTESFAVVSKDVTSVFVRNGSVVSSRICDSCGIKIKTHN